MRDDLRIGPLRAGEIDALVALTRDTWQHHYASIISQAQIDYMLAERYAPALILSQLSRQGVWWDTLHCDGILTGFVQYELGTAPGELKIDKLYIRYTERGRGHGGILLQHVEQEARSLGCHRLHLQVNKNNASAIGAYRKHGFEITDSAVFDIGNGFVMDDYIMSKALAPLPPLPAGAAGR